MIFRKWGGGEVNGRLDLFQKLICLGVATRPINWYYVLLSAFTLFFCVISAQLVMLRLPLNNAENISGHVLWDCPFQIVFMMVMTILKRSWWWWQLAMVMMMVIALEGWFNAVPIWCSPQILGNQILAKSSLPALISLLPISSYLFPGPSEVNFLHCYFSSFL